MQTCFFSSYAECPVNLPLLVYNRDNEKNTKKVVKSAHYALFWNRSFLFLWIFLFKGSDGCTSHIPLNDRTRAAGVHRGNLLRCDQKDLATPKWYRFTGASGNMMPTSCVPKHYCGTHAPGWLSGSHPTSVGQIVKGKVCFHWGVSCCHWHANVQIKKCNGFYVYKLERTPVCWLRYCGNAGHGKFEFHYHIGLVLIPVFDFCVRNFPRNCSKS